jgi:hypothetical protein
MNKLKDFITIHGELGRKEYFILLIQLTVGYYLLIILATIIMIIISSLVINENSIWSELFAIIFILILISATIFNILASLFMILRRARQTSYFILWLIVGVLVPFGSIIIGLIPAKKA